MKTPEEMRKRLAERTAAGNQTQAFIRRAIVGEWMQRLEEAIENAHSSVFPQEAVRVSSTSLKSAEHAGAGFGEATPETLFSAAEVVSAHFAALGFSTKIVNTERISITCIGCSVYVTWKETES